MKKTTLEKNAALRRMTLAMMMAGGILANTKAELSPGGVVDDAQNLLYGGRLKTLVAGINGVQPGGNVLITLPTNVRVHDIQLNCTAINYSSPTGVAIAPVILVSAAGVVGTGTITPTIVNGQITGFVGTAGTSATFAQGDTITIPDPTGQGAVWTNNGVGATLATANWALTSGGTPTPINPSKLITNVRVTVNGQNMIDLPASDIIGTAAVNGYLMGFGTLQLLFTEPWLNMLRDNETTSWDLFGQDNWNITLTLTANCVTPGIVGQISSDANRNTRAATKSMAASGMKIANAQGQLVPVTVGMMVPFLNPVAKRTYTQALIIGQNDIITFPRNYPIRRMYFRGSLPGNLYKLKIVADGVTIFEGSAQQLYEAFNKYNFQVGNVFYAPTGLGGGYGGSTTLGNGSPSTQPLGGAVLPTTIPNGQLLAANRGSIGTVANNGPFPYDLVWIADEDQRPWEAMQVQQSLTVSIFSNVAQNLTTVVETLPRGLSEQLTNFN